MMDADQTIALRTFAQDRCLASSYEYTSPEEVYSEYVKFTAQPVDRIAFTSEMIRLGFIIYRPDKNDPMVETGWRLRLRQPDCGMVEPVNDIQDQLETLRNQTFKSILDARRGGRLNLAIQLTKSYLDIVKARREEFPPNTANKEGADFADPE